MGHCLRRDSLIMPTILSYVSDDQYGIIMLLPLTLYQSICVHNSRLNTGNACAVDCGWDNPC